MWDTHGHPTKYGYPFNIHGLFGLQSTHKSVDMEKNSYIAGLFPLAHGNSTICRSFPGKQNQASQVARLAAMAVTEQEPVHLAGNRLPQVSKGLVDTSNVVQTMP